MTAQDQRAFKRFDIFSVVECKPLNQLNKSPFYGIMKNFSYGGFSMETQYDRLEPGQQLEFRLKDPHSELLVTEAGEIVWKDKASKFECRMGVKFSDADVENRIKMLEIASVSGGIPVDFFLSEETVENGVANATEEEADAAFSDEVREQLRPEAVQEDIEIVSSDAIDNHEEPEEGKAEEAAVEEINEDDDYTLDRETDEGDDDMASYRERPGGGKKWIYVVITLIAAAVLGYLLSPIYEKKGDELRSQGKAPTETAGKQDIGIITSPVTITDELSSKGNPVEIEEQNPVLPAEEPVKPVETVRPVTPPPALSPVRANSGKEYFIQAGAWKNPAYAKEMLTKLKKRYPDTYMIDENGFHKIRIPGIRSETEGNKIIRAIQETFMITPLLVAKKQG